ncbi:hypothetical protein MVEN_01504400 [Mycena venus]|uniref:Uncharacterized protein n=1 Tax=Mycena venus TaxID=2733690 RepID=A0A8H6XW75_9AGAR|nr:hypothetical protein MVEN_01504400 [Mycena venus]
MAFAIIGWNSLLRGHLNLRGVLAIEPVAFEQVRLPIFDSLTRQRPFYAALPLARREAYDHTARLLLVFALLAEQHRAARAFWAGGVPVPFAPGRTVIPSDLELGKLQMEVEVEQNLEQVWYDAVQTRLDSALLDLIII